MDNKSEKTSLTIDKTVNGIRGTISLNENVVATIAGLACRGVKGLHSLGKSRLISFSNNSTHGVDAEVGKEQAAIDLDVVIEYGCDIKQVTKEARQRIAEAVNKMAGREVVEVNLNVIDIKLPEDKPVKEREGRRVV